MITILLLVLFSIVFAIVALNVRGNSKTNYNKKFDWIHQDFETVNSGCGDYYHGSDNFPQMEIVEDHNEI